MKTNSRYSILRMYILHCDCKKKLCRPAGAGAGGGGGGQRCKGAVAVLFLLPLLLHSKTIGLPSPSGNRGHKEHHPFPCQPLLCARPYGGLVIFASNCAVGIEGEGGRGAKVQQPFIVH